MRTVRRSEGIGARASLLPPAGGREATRETRKGPPFAFQAGLAARCGRLPPMLSAILASLPLILVSPPAGFDACDRLAASQPEAEATAKCYDDVGTSLKQPEVEAARLRDLLKRFPGSPWPTFYLAFLDTAHAGELFRAAAAGFAARQDAGGEVRARSNVYRLLYNAGRVDEAGREAERTTRVAEASRDPELIARARILQARQLMGTGQDLEQADGLPRPPAAVRFPNRHLYAQRSR